MKTESNNLKTAFFAGGCFWCVESDFEKVDGVVEVISGYTGGQTLNPSCKQVSAGGTGHAEAVQVHYDPDKITYKELPASTTTPSGVTVVPHKMRALWRTQDKPFDMLRIKCPRHRPFTQR